MKHEDSSMASDGFLEGEDQGGDEEVLALAIAGSGTGVWDRDIRTGVIEYSRAWKAMLGYAEDEISDRIEDSYTRVHPDDLAMVQARIDAHLKNHTEMYEVEHRLRCKDGHYKWVLSRGRVALRDANGNALRMAGVTTDISDTVALSEKLRQSAALLTSLTDEIPGVVYQYSESADGHRCFPYASAGIADIYGTTPQRAALSAASVEAAIHPDDFEGYRSSLALSAATLERWHLEFRVVLPVYGERWCQGDARPHRLPDGGTLWYGFVADITERKHIEAALRDAASTDFLTGLPNRRHFMARMEQELARVQRDGRLLTTVLMFDLDHFKLVNDLHGHAAGDEVLKHFARILQHELRKVDAAGRIGGEEFAVVLAGADAAHAQAFAGRVRERLAALPVRVGVHTVNVTVSVGVAAMRALDLSVNSSLSRADSALYNAKEMGRNRVEIAPE
jgi:diguanylate cyclase (GGDEF)-like protein/PAS domain S-box-containing protein